MFHINFKHCQLLVWMLLWASMIKECSLFGKGHKRITMCTPFQEDKQNCSVVIATVLGLLKKRNSVSVTMPWTLFLAEAHLRLDNTCVVMFLIRIVAY